MSKTVRHGKVVNLGEVLPQDLTLEITYEVDQRAGEIIDWAFANPVPFATVKVEFEKAKLNGMVGVAPPEASLTIPRGFEVAYWHEETSGGVPIRRLSVTCPAKAVPQAAVGVIMKLFGFVNPLVNCKVWMHQISKKHYAVNVLEPVTGDWESLKGPIH